MTTQHTIQLLCLFNHLIDLSSPHHTATIFVHRTAPHRTAGPFCSTPPHRTAVYRGDRGENRTTHISTDQLDELEFVEPEIEHREPIIVGFFIL